MVELNTGATGTLTDSPPSWLGAKCKAPPLTDAWARTASVSRLDTTGQEVQVLTPERGFLGRSGRFRTIAGTLGAGLALLAIGAVFWAQVARSEPVRQGTGAIWGGSPAQGVGGGAQGVPNPPVYQPPAEARCGWVGWSWVCDHGDGRREVCVRVGDNWRCTAR